MVPSVALAAASPSHGTHPPGLGELGRPDDVHAHDVDVLVARRQPPDELLPLLVGAGRKVGQDHPVPPPGLLGADLGRVGERPSRLLEHVELEGGRAPAVAPAGPGPTGAGAEDGGEGGREPTAAFGPPPPGHPRFVTHRSHNETGSCKHRPRGPRPAPGRGRRPPSDVAWQPPPGHGRFVTHRAHTETRVANSPNAAHSSLSQSEDREAERPDRRHPDRVGSQRPSCRRTSLRRPWLRFPRGIAVPAPHGGGSQHPCPGGRPRTQPGASSGR